MGKTRKTSLSKCLIPECRNLEKVRGLCHNCISTAYKSIKRGEVTDNELVQSGLILPKNPFRQALENLKESQSEKEQS